jgi:hypothetical protein
MLANVLQPENILISPLGPHAKFTNIFLSTKPLRKIGHTRAVILRAAARVSFFVPYRQLIKF